MKTCRLSEFMQTLEPWLSKDYLRRVCLEKEGRIRLVFADGVSDTYCIDDCTKAQLGDILRVVRERGIPIEE